MTSEKGLEQRLVAAARKAARDNDAVQAMKDYQAARKRVDANTARLRALRLAKEAADAAAVPEPAVQRKAPARRASRSRAST